MSSWASHVEDELAAQGHRRSASRRVVLELLAGQPCCVSATDLFDAARESGRRIGIASVYRVLDLLSEKGFVQKLDLGADHAVYERVHEVGHHHHLVCNECGRVETFSDDKLEAALRRIEGRTGFSVESHDVLLRGACETCQA
jgi:Fur family ferric uptake transcriptional regulator